ncbi:MAG: hypothetical protein HOP14_03920 [Acidobacteria bacterium]|nr:hypothetical protein [Acidobacteriota bacterium]
MFRTVILAAVTAFAIGLPAQAAAQQAMTQDDLLRLQDNIYQAERELTVLGTSDTARAAQFRLSLDELRDEVTYSR